MISAQLPHDLGRLRSRYRSCDWVEIATTCRIGALNREAESAIEVARVRGENALMITIEHGQRVHSSIRIEKGCASRSPFIA